MALFKILKGEQSKLPSQLNEGWAYVAKDTLTLNGHNVNFVNFYVDYDASTRLKINEVSEIAVQAIYDDVDKVSPISTKYLAGLTLHDDALTPSYNLVNGIGGTKTTVNLPVASETYAGVITTGAQIIAGNKTFNGGLNIKSAGNAVLHILGQSATVDYIQMYVDGNSNNARPIVLQNGYGNIGIGNIIAPTEKVEIDGNVKATKFIGDLQGKLVNARTISISSAAGTTGTSFDGSANVSLIIPKTLTSFTSITSTTFVGALSGNATSADKLNTNAGSSTQPIYFSGGKPVAITGAIGNDTTGNAATATKLKTARSINLGTAVTSKAQSFNGSANITISVTGVKEAYLSWGGKNLSGQYGPIDAAMVPELGANRLAFMPADSITVEYSNNGGSTWTDYGASTSDKINLFNGNGTSLAIGKATSSSKATADSLLRITIATKDAKVYTALNKFCIYVSTNGSSDCWCTIRGRLQSNYTSNVDTWTTFSEKAGLSGWSGYNIINTSNITTYGNTASSQYGQVQFIFGADGSAASTSYSGLNILKIFGFGGVGWTTPSTMAKTGHIYSWDSSQNTSFPAQVTATQFNGPLDGNATTATTLKTGRAIIIGAEAKSDASSGVSFNGSANVTLKLPQTLSGFTQITSTEFVGKLIGNAASASKLIDSNATDYAVGSTTLPVYFSGGVPVTCNADDVFSALSWATGTTAGPTLKVTVADKERTAVIPSASQGGSGVVTTGDQTWAGKKTFQGQVVLQSNVDTDAANTGALNLSNSNIFGVNGIYFADLSDNAQEGLQWYRDSTHVDTIYVKSGMIYFTPNRTYGSAGTNRVIPTVTDSTTTAGYPIVSTTTAGNNIYNQAVVIERNIITLNPVIMANRPTEGKFVGNLEGKLVNARNFVINVAAASVAADATAGPATVFDASSNVSLQLPSILKDFDSITSTTFTGDLTGNATTASQLTTSPVSAYGTCSTAAATAAKVITIADTNWQLKVGTIIGIKFTNSNSASNVTLNVNNTGAKSIAYSGTYPYTGSLTTYCGYAGRVTYYMYDGTYWVWLNDSWSLNSDTYPSAYCSTAAATAAKTATCTNWVATAKSYIHISFRYANSSATAITLNINSTTAKPVYINGAASSTTNYTLPAGSYIAYYDGTNYYLRTDGKLTADITGNAATATKLATARTIKLTGDVTGSGSFDGSANLSITATVVNDSHSHNDYVPYTAAGNADFNKNIKSGFYRVNSNLTNGPAGSDWGQLLVMHGGGDTITQIYGDYNNGNLFTRSGNPSDVDGAGTWTSWKQIWIQGNSVTGAVWNDYAECRESDCEEFGYVLMEAGDDSLTKTTKRLSHFAGVSSDTWGFSQGETDKAKIPIAVAGRVLVYPYQDRNNYKPGDCVCAAPNGTIDIMTREEIIKYPDRIVGTVSCVPEYEQWGGGNNTDREPVKVNGRIWIKVR